MMLPRALRRLNRDVSNHFMGLIAWILPPFAVVNHRGRQSGRAYRTPVVAFFTDSRVVIPMGYGRDVDWGLNLLAAGAGTLTRMGRKVPVLHPRIVDGPEAAPLLPWPIRGVFLAARLPGYMLLQL